MKFLEIFRNLISHLHPELPARTHVPLRSRVIAVHGESGDVQPTSGPRRYSVDVQPIRDDGTNDPDRAVLVDVALPVQWAGSERGIFCLPAVGSVCLIGFVDGNAGWPYVHSILPDGWNVPAIDAGEILIQQSPDRLIRLTPTGELQITLMDEGKLLINVDGDTLLTCTGDLTAHAAGDAKLTATGHVELGDVGGAWVARVGDPVEVEGHDSRGDYIRITGVITSGSTKVRAS